MSSRCMCKRRLSMYAFTIFRESVKRFIYYSIFRTAICRCKAIYLLYWVYRTIYTHEHMYMCCDVSGAPI